MSDGIFLPKSRAIAIGVWFVIALVAVGLISGLTGKKNCGQSETKKPEGDTVVSPTEQGPWTDPFLPDNLLPVHYDLWIYPDFYDDGSTYWGKVSITINITQDTNYLIVHIKVMNITEVNVYTNPTGSQLNINKQFEYKQNQYYYIETENVMCSGTSVILSMEFTSSLGNGMNGIYKSTYKNSQTGKTSWLISTQFEPTNARKAFPSFDEPKYKATYVVTLKHWANFTALSNMPAERSVAVDEDFMETTFQRSVPMSNYLLCMIICDFSYKETTLENGKPHRVWAAPDKISQVDFALEVGTAMMNWMERYFGVRDPLPKLDQIAVPDFASEAMEHWGLVTYRERALLYDPSRVSTEEKEWVALVLGHELVHTYFGNLVTCDWWDNIWLNEGFAMYYMYKAMEEAKPEWQTEDYYAVHTQQRAMKTDSGANSRPVLVQLAHPDAINEAFDAIAYYKGGGLVRMMEDFFGKEKFRLSMGNYIKRFKYGNANTQELWDSLQTDLGSGLDISRVMKPWTEQMGLPVVDISIDQAGVITARQKRFLYNPSSDPNMPESPYGYKWYIPLTYTTPSIAHGMIWMNDTESVTFDDPRQSTDGWIKFNVRQAGFYRINYSPDMWRHLSDVLFINHNVISAVERWNLLDDAFNLAMASQLDYSIVLDLTKYMGREMDFYPWRGVHSALSYVSSRLYGHEHYGLWRKYIRDLSARHFTRLGVDSNGNHHQKMLRADILEMSCLNGNEECLQNVSEMFTNWIEDPVAHPVSPDLRSQVYRIGMMETGEEVTWDTVWERCTNATSAQEKEALLNALASTPQFWLLQKYLNYCNDSDKVKSQDFFHCVAYAAARPVGRMYTWNWIRRNYDVLIQRFGTGDRHFGVMVPNLVKKFDSEYQLKEVQALFEKYPEAGAGERARGQALESIKSNIVWKKTNVEPIIGWLKQNV